MQAVSNISSSDDIEFNTKVIKGVINVTIKFIKKEFFLFKLQNV